MARPTTTAIVNDILSQNELTEDQISDPKIPLFTQPKGISFALPLSNLGTDISPYMKNMRFGDEGVLTTRYGTVALGGMAAEAQLGTVLFRDQNDAEYIVRVTMNTVQVWDGANWNICTGPSLGLSQYDAFNFTVWNQYLLLECTTGMYQIDVPNYVFTLIATAPQGKGITTFDGRVVVSYVLASSNLPTRIQWSVKDDNTDWAGLGSGFEDLLSAPGGVVDIQHGIYPINDQEALCIRSSSVWLVTLTGQFDAPFQFDYLFGGINVDAPNSVAPIPGGVILLSRNNVEIVTVNGTTHVGDPVRKQLFNSNNRLHVASGGYDPFLREYRLTIPQKVFSGISSVYRYRVESQQWFNDEYPYQIKRIYTTSFEPYTPISALPGSISSLSGPIDELGIGGIQHTMIITQDGAGYVIQENLAALTDADGAGGTINIPIEIDTGLMARASILDYAEITEQQIELVTQQATTIQLDYKDELGSWLPYSTIAVPGATIMPTPFIGRQWLRRKQMQLRMTSTNGGGIQMAGWFLSMTQGGRINY